MATEAFRGAATGSGTGARQPRRPGDYVGPTRTGPDGVPETVPQLPNSPLNPNAPRDPAIPSTGGGGGPNDPTGGYLTIADRLAQLLGSGEGRITATPTQTLTGGGGNGWIGGAVLLVVVLGGGYYLYQRNKGG